MKLAAYLALMALLLGSTNAAMSTTPSSKSDFTHMKAKPGAVMLSPTDPAVLDFRRRAQSGSLPAAGLVQGRSCAVGDALRIQEEAVCERTRHDGKDGLLCCAANCNYACGGGRLQGRCTARTTDCAFVPALR